jgi:predicted TIM-barrel fold metal-dependent hydrolase
VNDTALLDTHVHFWDHAVAGLHWPFLEPGFEHGALRGTDQLDQPAYLPPDLMRETEGSDVIGVVHVQAVGETADPSLETRWLAGVAARHGWPNAIVASCYLWRPEAPELLRRHVAETHLVRGIRDLTAVQRLDAETAAHALDVACELELSIEVRRRLDGFEAIATIAQRWPDITVVLSHACFPGSRSPSELEAWRSALDGLAAYPNVVCKISAAAGSGDPSWTAESIAPWVHGCIGAFGSSRCMFGSNWPIDRLYGSYAAVVGAYRKLTAHLSPDARADLFHGTAQRVYRL